MANEAAPVHGVVSFQAGGEFHYVEGELTVYLNNRSYSAKAAANGGVIFMGQGTVPRLTSPQFTGRTIKAAKALSKLGHDGSRPIVRVELDGGEVIVGKGARYTGEGIVNLGTGVLSGGDVVVDEWSIA